MITGINHITLAVSNLEQSLQFYTKTLGLTGHMKWDNGAYLSAGDLWLCLSCDDPCAKDDYSHIAFNISPDNFATFSSQLKSHGVKLWRENKSEGKSLYILDPDGHKLELHTGDLKSRLESVRSRPYSGVVWL